MVLGLLALSHSYAQTYRMRHFTPENGLAHHQVLDLFQDSKGFLWIGTKGGASRFDGRKFLNFSEKDSIYKLNDDRVHAIFEDHQQNIWLATNRGLNKFDGKKVETYTLDGCKQTLHWAQKSDDCFYLCVEDSTKKRYFVKFEDGKFTPAHQQYKFFFHNGNEYLQPSNSYVIYKKTPEGKKEFWRENKSIHLIPAGKKHLWIHSGNKILVFQNDSLIFTKKAPDFAGIRKSFFHKNRIYISDANGVYVFDQQANLLELIELKQTRDVLVDKDESLWIATERGLFQIPHLGFKFFGDEHGIEGTYWSVVEDRRQRLWVSGYALPVKTYDGKKFEVIYKSPENDFYPGGKTGFRGEVLFPFSDGIVVFDKGKSVTIGKDSVYAPFMLFKDTINRQFVAPHVHGLAFFAGNQIENYPNGFGNNLCVTLGADQNYWLATNSGLKKFDGEKFHSLPGKPANQPLMAVFQDKIQNLWFGGRNGIAYYDYQDFRQLEISLQKGVITGFFQSPDSLLLIGTQKGLVVLDLKLFYEQGKIDIQIFDALNGFHTEECQQNSFMQDSKGYIWLPLTNHIARINTRFLRTKPTEPYFYLEQMQWQDDSMNWQNTTKRSFDHTRQNFRFLFSGIALKAPEGLRFRYKLEGHDKDWSAAVTENFAQYTSLPPGKYRFLLKAKKYNGKWSAPKEMATFVISPAFWQTPVAWGLAALFVIGVIFGLVVLRTRRVQRRKAFLLSQKLEAQRQIRNRVYSILHNDIGNMLTAAMWGVQLRDKNNSYEKEVDLIKQAAGKAREVSHLIRLPGFVEHTLPQELKMLTARFQGYGVEIGLAVVPETGWEKLNVHLARAVYSIVQELLQNTFKYADCSQIQIQLTKNTNSVSLIYSDNGKGFDSENIKGGTGLQSIRETVQEFQGNAEILTSEGQGTEVYIQMRQI